MRARGIRISPERAEGCRMRLQQLGLLDRTLRSVSLDGMIVFPVTAYPAKLEEGERCEADFPDSSSRRNYRDIVELPGDAMPLLPSSFDMIGTKALVKLPAELERYGEEIGRAILEAHGSLDSVFQDRGVAGEFRLRRLTLLAGKGGTETKLNEYGLRIALDVAKTFYSPRLASERRRIGTAVGPGERVLDMFAGVGPFALHAARSASSGHVVAIDINPYAVSYMRENAASNSAGNMEVHLKDAAEYTGGPFDRIIMNLPAGGAGFVGRALAMLADGGTVDYYELIEDRDLEKRILSLEAEGGRVESHRKVKSYSPVQGIYHFTIRKDVHRGARA